MTRSAKDWDVTGNGIPEGSDIPLPDRTKPILELWSKDGVHYGNMDADGELSILDQAVYDREMARGA